MYLETTLKLTIQELQQLIVQYMIIRPHILGPIIQEDVKTCKGLYSQVSKEIRNKRVFLQNQAFSLYNFVVVEICHL
jgi:hypothetical protein